MGQLTKKKMKKKRRDSRVKTRKGGLEQKRENLQRLVGGVNKKNEKAMTEQHPKHI